MPSRRNEVASEVLAGSRYGTPAPFRRTGGCLWPCRKRMIAFQARLVPCRSNPGTGALGEWIAWARAPGHDSYWRFHRDDFLRLVPPPGRLTLEIGCGEGRVLRDLVRAGHQAVGLDLSTVLARAATTHPEAVGQVVVADAVSLPFPDAVADCVVAFMSLQDIEGFEQAVMEAGRVLTPSGILRLGNYAPTQHGGNVWAGPNGAGPPVRHS